MASAEPERARRPRHSAKRNTIGTIKETGEGPERIEPGANEEPPPQVIPAPNSGAPRLRQPASATAVRVKQTEHREFVEVTQPASEQPGAGNGAQAANTDDPGDEYTAEPVLPDGWDYVDDEDDQLRRFMHGIQGDASDLRVAIKRLPDSFELRGKFRQPCTAEIQHGDIAFDADNLINNIRDTLGGGKYRLTIKSGSQHRFLTRPIELVIADPPGWHAPTPAITAALNGNGKPEKPLDAIEALITQAAQFKRLREALGIAEPVTGVAAPAGQGASTDPRMLIAQSLVGDTGLVEEVVNSLMKVARRGDSPEPDPWYKDVAMTFVRNEQVSPLLVHAGLSVLTSILEILQRFGGKTIGPAPAPGASAGTATNGEAQGPTAPPPYNWQQPATSSPQEPNPMPEDPDAPPYLKVLDFIVDRLRDNATVAADEDWVIELYERWPDEIAQAELMLRTLPIPGLKLILTGIDPDYQEAFALPHADQFLSDLKSLASKKEQEP